MSENAQLCRDTCANPASAREQDGCISVLLYPDPCVLSWFSELAQAECITCLQALKKWHSLLPVADNVSRTCVSKIPQLFSGTECGKKGCIHQLFESYWRHKVPLL